jgi:hypothetical protein
MARHLLVGKVRNIRSGPLKCPQGPTSIFGNLTNLGILLLIALFAGNKHINICNKPCVSCKSWVHPWHVVMLVKLDFKCNLFIIAASFSGSFLKCKEQHFITMKSKMLMLSRKYLCMNYTRIMQEKQGSPIIQDTFSLFKRNFIDFDLINFIS